MVHGEEGESGLGAEHQTTNEVGPESGASALFTEAIVSREFLCSRLDTWGSRVTFREAREAMDGLSFSFFSMSGQASFEVFVDEEEWIAYISVYSGNVRAYVARRDRDMDAAGRTLASFRGFFPPTNVDERRHEIPLTFWTGGATGPSSYPRTITVPSWDEIHRNYPAGIRERVGDLMTFRPGSAGQLFLFQGEAGTGKTYALRALGWEWRRWARFHYITDPERFFGQDAAYMMSVILGPEANPWERNAIEDEEPELWRVLVLEDTGELMSADAQTRSGQGLARLLNLVDGLIGQGLRVLVLVTTNEPLTRLHPAVQRPGRCAARLEFRPFTRDEADEWLAEYGVDKDAAARSRATLAEMYGALSGVDLGGESLTTVGFAS